MKIFISGISGTGMGPLALMAKAAGLEVAGSDLSAGAIYPELLKAGIEVKIGVQDGEFLKEQILATETEGLNTAAEAKIKVQSEAKNGKPNDLEIATSEPSDEPGSKPLVWFVHTSALPENHPELTLAKEKGLKVTKRDELTAYLVEKLGLKMVAVAGTHGKTTTTSMLVYTAVKLGLPVAYIVGTTLGFAPSGAYQEGDKYLIYEADEYDRNFLKFHPWLSLITCATYDHPDIYKTPEEYQAAFLQFKSQSENVITLKDGIPVFEKRDPGFEKMDLGAERFSSLDFTLAGEARREDATLAAAGIMRMMMTEGLVDTELTGSKSGMDTGKLKTKIIEILNTFPGVGRRFEKIADGIYSDYAHHPEEIAATMKVAKDECQHKGKKGIIAIYEPHQNTRQHEVRNGYKKVFKDATRIFWLPTYLTREDESLPILKPEELIAGLENANVAELAELDEILADTLRKYQKDGYLILLMTAGPADGWLRENFDLPK